MKGLLDVKDICDWGGKDDLCKPGTMIIFRPLSPLLVGTELSTDRPTMITCMVEGDGDRVVVGSDDGQ